jgi:hypothetical protein
MTWNAEGILSNGRELTLLNLLNDNDVDVGIVTETEIPSSGHGDYNVEGYYSYLPLSPSELLKTAKYWVVVLVRSAVATVTKICSDLMHAAVQSFWIQLDMQGTPRCPGTRVLVCGMNREGVVGPGPGDDRSVQGQGAAAGGNRRGGQHCLCS